MAEKTIEIKGLEELIEQIGKLGNLKDELYAPLWKAFGQAGKLLEGQIKQNLTDGDQVGLGDLRGSVSSSETQLTETAIFVEVGAGRKLQPYNYAEAVEYGTGPAAGHPAYTPPLALTEPGQPLYEWVQVKQMAGVYSLKTQKRLGSKAKRINETQKVARSIWGKIRREGTRPHPFFFKALDQQREAIDGLFAQAIDELLKRLKK